MMKMQELLIDRDNYRNTKIIETKSRPLVDGEVRVAIDKYGLTANNVSYAVSGDMIGYWKYYPVESENGVNWGKVPVWGMADIVESKCNGVEVGERIYGFLSMSSEVIMRPGKMKAASFVDMAEHRKPLPELYNGYSRTEGEPALYKTLENERCLLFPLFITGYVLADFLADNDYWGAEQILIGSVSSKTGFGMAAFLNSETNFSGKLVGLTSSGNKAFVESLGDCQQIVTYGKESEIDSSKKAAYVDMSGNGELRNTLHNHLGNNMVRSIGVGATHWEERRSGGEMPGAKPEFFFAPAQIGKRNKDWGPGVLMQKAYAAGAQLAARTSDNLNVEFLNGMEAARDIWIETLDNKVSPKRGIMVSLEK